MQRNTRVLGPVHAAVIVRPEEAVSNCAVGRCQRASVQWLDGTAGAGMDGRCCGSRCRSSSDTGRADHAEGYRKYGEAQVAVAATPPAVRCAGCTSQLGGEPVRPAPSPCDNDLRVPGVFGEHRPTLRGHPPAVGPDVGDELPGDAVEDAVIMLAAPVAPAPLRDAAQA